MAWKDTRCAFWSGPSSSVNGALLRPRYGALRLVVDNRVEVVTADEGRAPNNGWTTGQRRRRWPGVHPVLGQRDNFPQNDDGPGVPHVVKGAVHDPRVSASAGTERRFHYDPLSPWAVNVVACCVHAPRRPFWTAERPPPGYKADPSYLWLSVVTAPAEPRSHNTGWMLARALVRGPVSCAVGCLPC